MISKNEIRQEIKFLRKKLPKEQKESNDLAIRNNLDKFLTQKTIAVFYPKEDEIDLLPLNNQKRNFLIPRTNTDSYLDFYPLRNNLILNKKFNILEPRSDGKLYYPDILICPLLAFDENKNRLGYGAGYYDKTIAYLKKIRKELVTIGVAYDFQQRKNLPIEKHDITLDYIITESRFLS